MELGHAGWADHTHVPTRLLIVWDGVGADEKATGQRQAIEQRYESALPKSSIPAQSPKVSKNSALKHRLPGCPGAEILPKRQDHRAKTRRVLAKVISWPH